MTVKVDPAAQALIRARADEQPPPGPVSDEGQAGEHEVALLMINRRMVTTNSTRGYRVPGPLAGPHLTGRLEMPGGGPGWRSWTIAAT